MAQETINCRLDRVPIAEGCPPDPNSLGGMDCEMCAEAAGYGTQLMELPAVDQDPVSEVREITPSSLETPADSKKAPFRTGFDDRYRAQGGVDARHQRIRESEDKPQDPRQAKTNTLKRIFGL